MKPYDELVKSVKFIEFTDLCDLIGAKHSYRNFLFPTESANDSYVPIHCDDYTLEQMYDDFDTSCRRENWREQYANEIKLVETLRNTYGIRDTVLTYVSW